MLLVVPIMNLVSIQCWIVCLFRKSWTSWRNKYLLFESICRHLNTDQPIADSHSGMSENKLSQSASLASSSIPFETAGVEVYAFPCGGPVREFKVKPEGGFETNDFVVRSLCCRIKGDPYFFSDGREAIERDPFGRPQDEKGEKMRITVTLTVL